MIIDEIRGSPAKYGAVLPQKQSVGDEGDTSHERGGRRGKLLTVGDVAQKLAVSRKSVYRLIERGEIPARNIAPEKARRALYRITALDLRTFIKGTGTATP